MNLVVEWWELLMRVEEWWVCDVIGVSRTDDDGGDDKNVLYYQSLDGHNYNHSDRNCNPWDSFERSFHSSHIRYGVNDDILHWGETLVHILFPWHLAHGDGEDNPSKTNSFFIQLSIYTLFFKK
jgi:hypothetical protein